MANGESTLTASFFLGVKVGFFIEFWRNRSDDEVCSKEFTLS